ncbi:MAG: SRPBCC family protein [Ginsengibacter sp.]
MWQKSFSTVTTEVTQEQIWKVITDISKWSEWDKDIEFTEINGDAKLNACFFLKPKGGPKTKLTISQFDKPHVFADVAHLPLAKMQTIHSLTQSGESLKIQVDIKVTGLLTFLWSKVIAQKQIDGGISQTNQLIAKAKSI